MAPAKVVCSTAGGGRALAGMPPSTAETGMGFASSGGPGTPFKDVGGKGTLMAAARAAAAAVGGMASEVVGMLGTLPISIFISLGPGVEVLEEAPLLLVESVEPSCCIFSLLLPVVVVFSLASMSPVAFFSAALAFSEVVDSEAEAGTAATPSLSLASFSIFSISEVSRMFPTSSSSSGCAEET